jgi:hypothetical protein
MSELGLQAQRRGRDPQRKRTFRAKSGRLAVSAATAGLVALATATAVLPLQASATTGSAIRMSSAVRVSTTARVPHTVFSCQSGQEQMTFTNSSDYPGSGFSAWSC